MPEKKKPLARVRIFGHPITVEGDIVSDPCINMFAASGGMYRSDNEPVEGACFFVFPVDYSGLNPAFPRAYYSHLLILYNFDWSTRQGEYIHIPYGGRIEIEAI